jgi:hypothetical protein
MITIIPVWLAAAILVGFFGRRYRFGFWGYFFVSILLTPIIGVLMLIAAVPRRVRKSSAPRHS